jgi:hypothetical protein
MSKGKFIIYGLADPRTGEIRYVGKSCSGLIRPRAHRKPCMLRRDTNRHKVNWIEQLQAAGISYSITVLEEAGAALDLDALEQKWIAFGRSSGWPLTNLSDGGGGTTGMKLPPKSDAFKAMMRARMTGRPSPLRGRKIPQEKRERIRAALMGHGVSEETRAKISASLRANPSVAEAQRGKHPSAETIERLRISHAGHRHSTGTIAKMCLVQRMRRAEEAAARNRNDVQAAN